MNVRIFYHICLFLIVIVIFAGNTYIVQTNAETLNNDEEYIQEDDYKNIQNSLDELEGENYFDFKKCVEDISLNGLSGISEYLEYFKLKR